MIPATTLEQAVDRSAERFSTTGESPGSNRGLAALYERSRRLSWPGDSRFWTTSFDHVGATVGYGRVRRLVVYSQWKNGQEAGGATRPLTLRAARAAPPRRPQSAGPITSPKRDLRTSGTSSVPSERW